MGLVTYWTEEEIKLAREMYAEGMTFGEIGDKLGRSRNSVAGLSKRLGFPTRNIQKKQKPKPECAVFPVKKQQKKSVESEELPTPPKKMIIKPILTQACQSLLDLGVNDCRWPIGDDDFVFCGNQKKENCSYCEDHFKLAYVARKQI